MIKSINESRQLAEFTAVADDQSGLTPKALRHDDRIGLLRAAQVDRVHGYRLYHRDQVAQARLVRLLRCLDLPLDQILQTIPGQRRNW